ncbi:MAG: flavin-containing monooxygenase [Blastococcus sp.]
MAIAHSPEPFSEDEEGLRAILQDAELPSLMPALAQVTGDLSLIDPSLRPNMRLTAAGVDPQGGIPPEAQARARELAVQALLRYREGGYRVHGDLAPDQIRQLMEFVTGDGADDYLPLMAHELAMPVDAGAPQWTVEDVAPGVDWKVVVVGAGMSGLVAAHRLAQAGVDFVVLEKNDDVGGTWYENSYPGCRLDTNNFAYSFSFAQKDNWPHRYSARDAIWHYFRDVADDLDLRRNIRFEQEVVAATFDEAAATWTVRVRPKDGEEYTLTANAVLTAVGQLNRPNFPDIPGIDRFAGPSWHTAQWRHDESLTGKRVAVIGTGASAYQVVPSIVDDVAELHLFQRTPPWMLPAPDYHDELPAGLSWLFRHVPYYHRWYRFFQFWTSVEGRRPFMQVDPEWQHPVSVSARNEELREALTAHMQRQFADRPDLLAKVMPDYTPGAKRMMRDNGVWPAALKREHVDLVTEKIVEITEKGVLTADGVEHQVDVIIYATGFRASDFLTPMTITGRGGADLHERWAGDATAYLGMHVPDFPNLFIVFGPNTNLVINGSLILFSEMEVHYALECMRLLLDTGSRTMDVRPEVLADYQEKVDAANRLASWGVSSVNSWYKNKGTGRVSQVWPLPILDFWKLTREPDPANFVLD